MQICIERIDEKEFNAYHEYAIKPNTFICFQKGPIKEYGINGCQNEHLIEIVIDRLKCFQESEFSCRENALAITKLQEALHWLEERTKDRKTRGVEGYDRR